MKSVRLFALLFLFIACFLDTYAQNSEADNAFAAAQQKSKDGQLKEANDLYDKAAQRYAQDKNWSRYVGCFNGKGWNFVLAGKYDEAINIFNDAIKNGTEKLGEKNTAVGMAYNNRAAASLQMSRYDQAAADYTKCIEIWSPLLGETDNNVLMAWGNLATVYTRKGDLDAAIAMYMKLLPIMKKSLGDKHYEIANLYNAIGVTYAQKNATDKALDYQNKALEIRKTTYGENSDEVAAMYRNMGYACLEGSRISSAAMYFEKALNIHKKIYGENHRETARSYAGLASAYSELPDYAKAEVMMLKAIDIQSKTEGKTVQLASNMSKLGVIYAESGNNEKAIEWLEQTLKTDLELLGKNHPDVADDYVNLGTFYLRRNNHIRAAEYLAEAVRIQAATLKETDPRLAHSVTQLGLVMLDELKYTEALKFFETGLNIRIKAFGENDMRVAASYHNIGTAHYSLKDYDKALHFFEKSLNIKKKLLGEKHIELEGTYSNLGRAYSEHKKYDKAIRQFEAARQTILPVLGEKNMQMAAVYRNMADCYRQQKDEAKALEYLQKALVSAVAPFQSASIYENPSASQLEADLEILRILNMKGECFEEIYRQKNQQKDVQAAFETYQLGIEELIKLRGTFDTDYMRIYIGNVGSGLYEKALRTARRIERITLNADYLYKAMAIAEKSKAGTLLNAIQDANALRYAGLPPELVETENKLKNLCDYLSRQVNEHAYRGQSLDSIQLAKYGLQLADARRLHSEFIRQVEKDYPRYYALRYNSKGIDLKSFVKQTLKSNDVLVEYFVGKDSVYAFAVSQQGIEAFVMPQDNMLAYDIGLLRKQIADEKALRLYPTFKNYTRTAFNLYEMLLAPMQKTITGKNLIIVPDKELNQLPFEVLLTQEYTAKDQDYTQLPYLIKTQNIRYCSSAAVLAELSNSQKEATADYMAFAPVFAEGTAVGKVRHSTGIFRPAKEGVGEEGTRGYMRSGIISPIPETETEVKKVKQLFEEKQRQTKVYTFGEAHEDQLKSQTLSNYKYIHFATHGFCSDKSAGDASGIILSQEGNKKEDGVLYAGEVYGLQLNAKLVVLSACETGLGKEVSGEGLMGLARGFFHAGASGVVVSLWQVADQSTSQMMIDFFGKVLAQQPHDQALRQAKLQLIQKPETASPFYWAPFILQGR